MVKKTLVRGRGKRSLEIAKKRSEIGEAKGLAPARGSRSHQNRRPGCFLRQKTERDKGGIEKKCRQTLMDRKGGKNRRRPGQ